MFITGSALRVLFMLKFTLTISFAGLGYCSRPILSAFTILSVVFFVTAKCTSNSSLSFASAELTSINFYLDVPSFPFG
jgi:hypothetical protein